MTESFTRAPRPTGGDNQSFNAALRETLRTGDAVVIPLNGKSYQAMRSSKSSGITSHTKMLHVKVRTVESADGLSMLMWLEPKEPKAPVAP